MKIEYLVSPPEPASLLRIFEFTPSDLDSLCAQFLRLSESSVGVSVRLAPLLGVETYGLTSLDASVVPRDAGFIPAASASWQLTADTWLDVHDRAATLRPAVEGEFQWLDQTGSIPVLLSLSGQW